MKSFGKWLDYVIHVRSANRMAIALRQLNEKSFGLGSDSLRCVLIGNRILSLGPDELTFYHIQYPDMYASLSFNIEPLEKENDSEFVKWYNSLSCKYHEVNVAQMASRRRQNNDELHKSLKSLATGEFNVLIEAYRIYLDDPIAFKLNYGFILDPY